LAKNTRSTKNFLDLQKITRPEISALKLAILLEIVYVSYHLKTFTTFASLLKIDHAEAWKILYQQSSGFFPELTTRKLTKYFGSINLTFNQYISSRVILQYCSNNQHRSENNKNMIRKTCLLR